MKKRHALTVLQCFIELDGKGNSSANTGFFTYFKQGELGELDFVLDSGLSNITYDVNIDNINNPDVWLFSQMMTEQWQKNGHSSVANVVLMLFHK